MWRGVYSRGKITVECVIRRKVHVEELKKSYHWSLESKEEAVRKAGRKASHGFCRQCIKIALHTDERRWPLKCLSKDGAQLYLNFKVHTLCITDINVWVEQ